MRKNKIIFGLPFFFLLFFFLFQEALAAYSLSVSNFPQSINANDSVDTELSISVVFAANSDFYLRGSFYHSSATSDYFGYTDGYNGTVPLSFYKITTNDSGEWSGVLKIRPDINSSYFKGEGTYNFKIGYYTSGGSGPTWKYDNGIFLAYIPPSPTPTQFVPSLTPVPTETPIPTPFATYKINEVKNQDNEALSSVEIYVDDNYVHHYAPETLRFCNDCHCDPDNNIDCNLGNHTIKLKKSNYNEWSEVKTFNSADSFEVNPVMNLVSNPTLAPTITPIPTLTPTPTKKVTPTPTLIQITEEDELAKIMGNKAEEKPVVLGEQDSSTQAATIIRGREKVKITAAFFIIGGLVLLGLAGFFLMKEKYDSQNSVLPQNDI